MRKLILFLLVLTLSTSGGSAQSRKEKKAAKVTESAKPKSVPSGIKLPVSKSYADTYDFVLNWIKKADYTIESADRDNGLITTAITVAGGYSQTGSRVMLTLIKESDAMTTVKVVVTEQKRKKLLVTEPWSDPKVNDKETERVAELIKTAL
jgi:hypothetical protein